MTELKKLKMEARPLDAMVARIFELCPAAVQNGKIDFERLRAELGEDNLDTDNESYDFTWVGKRKAIRQASTPIRKTLRPDIAASKNWEKTENLYIQGDNLEVLKLLQESYLNKVKMIYIDPPYNTGKDFVYRDNFTQSKADYESELGLIDEDTGDRLFRNNETNGRFHSDWCSMIYPRLKLARDFLTDDGVIFISIDDNEVANLRKICDEVFGEDNFVAQMVWRKKYGGGKGARFFVDMHEYILCYTKNINILDKFSIPRTEEQKAIFVMEDEFISERGRYYIRPLKSGLAERKTLIYPIECPDGSFVNTQWICAKNTYEEMLKDGRIVFKKLSSGEYNVYKKFYENDTDGVLPESLIYDLAYNQNGKEEFKLLFGVKEGRDVYFDSPKPSKLIKFLSSIATNTNDIILDFFSGSATTAHAIMQLNAEDGGNRKFIMVQIPEETNPESEAFKAGYKNICEIGMERIRRAGDKIEESTETKNISNEIVNDLTLEFKQPSSLPTNTGIPDTGFRVLKLDGTNMADVYYTPADTKQSDLLGLVDNIKPDRQPLDLLFGVLVDWGVALDLPIETRKVGNHTIYIVDSRDTDGADLIACFDHGIPSELITEIANMHSTRVVFRDSSFTDTPSKINTFEIFKTLSPDTDVRVI